VVLFAAGLSIGISYSPHQFDSGDLGISDAGNGYQDRVCTALNGSPPECRYKGCQTSLRT